MLMPGRFIQIVHKSPVVQPRLRRIRDLLLHNRLRVAIDSDLAVAPDLSEPRQTKVILQAAPAQRATSFTTPPSPYQPSQRIAPTMGLSSTAWREAVVAKSREQKRRRMSF